MPGTSSAGAGTLEYPASSSPFKSREEEESRTIGVKGGGSTSGNTSCKAALVVPSSHQEDEDDKTTGTSMTTPVSSPSSTPSQDGSSSGSPSPDDDKKNDEASDQATATTSNDPTELTHHRHKDQASPDTTPTNHGVMESPSSNYFTFFPAQFYPPYDGRKAATSLPTPIPTPPFYSAPRHHHHHHHYPPHPHHHPQQLAPSSYPPMASSWPLPPTPPAQDMYPISAPAGHPHSAAATNNKQRHMQLAAAGITSANQRASLFETMAGIELVQFLLEGESRAMTLFNIEAVPMDVLRTVCEELGSLAYFRTEFKATKGVAFLAYYDLRVAIRAHHTLASELSRFAHRPVLVHYSIMLDTVATGREGILLVKNLPSSVRDSDVHAVFSSYGQLKNVTQRHNGDCQGGMFQVEYYDMQDAKLAAFELSTSTPWGSNVVVEEAERIDKELLLGQQLVLTLHRWAEEKRNGAMYGSPTPGNDPLKQAWMMRPYAPSPMNRRGLRREPGMMGGGFHDADFPLDIERVLRGVDKRTSLMVRNIPNKYTKQLLLHEINQNHRGQFDFFYLPIDFKNRCNMGYAFINFVDYRAIVSFFMEFNGQRWSSFNSEKVCTISYARIQGLQSLMMRFKSSEIMDKDWDYRPSFFHSSGLELDRPQPFIGGSGGGPGMPFHPAAAAASPYVPMGVNHPTPVGPMSPPGASGGGGTTGGLVDSFGLLNLHSPGPAGGGAFFPTSSVTW